MFVEQSVLSYITDLSLRVILGSRESGLSHYQHCPELLHYLVGVFCLWSTSCLKTFVIILTIRCQNVLWTLSS